MVFVMLIFHAHSKRAILESFYAKFGRLKFSPFAGVDSEREKLPFLSQNPIFGHFDPPK